MKSQLGLPISTGVDMDNDSIQPNNSPHQTALTGTAELITYLMTELRLSSQNPTLVGHSSTP